MRIDKSLEALARTLKDLRDNQNIFGGAIILSSCDFRNRSNVPHELNATFLYQDQTAIVFSKQLLDIGSGKVAIDISTGLISFPPISVTSQTRKWSLFSVLLRRLNSFQDSC